MKEIFLVLALLLLAGCNVAQETKENARVTCEQNGFKNLSNMRVEGPTNGNYTVDCNYDDLDRYNDLDVNKVGEDRFVIKIER